jgi:glycosyltransferase involved in cell wall biosynthesis
MIVKNEAAVIRRCLASVRPVINHWIIVDTGSSDGTQDIVRAAYADLPGELHERPWCDFATNRSEALALARSKADYSLIIDADDELKIPENFVLPELRADSYSIDIDFNGTRYRRPQLVKNSRPWRYEGVIHEWLTCDGPLTSGHLPLLLSINQDGARRSDASTFRRDAALLEETLRSETDPFRIARYTFYLAQSYRDGGDMEKAIDAYLRRTTLGFWDEEIFISFYVAAQLKEKLGAPDAVVLGLYAAATKACPSRAEASFRASRLCRLRNDFERGYQLAKAALSLPQPASGLFVESWIYDYGLLDELAVNAYWSGRYRECLDASLKALENGKIPAGEQPRFIANARCALDKLA